MAHDKIKAAARRRMAQTGESYAAARREVIREFQAARSSDPAADRSGSRSAMTTWARSPPGPTPCSAGARPEGGSRSTPAGSGSGWPTSRSTCRAPASAGPRGPRTPGAGNELGVHAGGGRWLANGLGGRPGSDRDRTALPHRAQPRHLLPPDDGHRTDRRASSIRTASSPRSSVTAFTGIPAHGSNISHGTRVQQGRGAGPDRARSRRGLDMAGHPAASRPSRSGGVKPSGGSPARSTLSAGRRVADRPPLPEVSAAVSAKSETQRRSGRRPPIAAPEIQSGAAVRTLCPAPHLAQLDRARTASRMTRSEHHGRP